MTQLSNSEQDAMRELAEAILGDDVDRIIERAVKMFGKRDPKQQDAIVDAALARASAAVIEQINARKFAVDPDASVVTVDSAENDVGIDLDYAARIKAGLSPEAWQLVRDFLLPRTVWRAFCSLAPIH